MIKSASSDRRGDVQARAQIMEKAAKVPASPCPLMMGVV